MFLQNFLQKYYAPDEKIILGCSAGPDSMFLLYHLLETSYKKNIVVAYFNHKTRAETDDEEQFLEDFCNKEGLTFEVASCDFEKLQSLYPSRSFEELAREKRYQFFDALMHIYSTNKVMLAHHRDDKIETFLFNMLRGTKLTGLINMTESSGGILRPLLGISKSEILEYLDKNNLEYKIDKTNLENTYTRNKIRNLVIPELEKIHPESKKNIVNLMQYFEELQNFLDEEVETFLALHNNECEEKTIALPPLLQERGIGGEVVRSFSLYKFLEKSAFLQKEIIRKIFFIANGGSTIGLSEANITEILKFLNGKNNKTKKEIKNLKMFKDGDTIYW